VSRRIIPGAQNKGTNTAMASEATIKTPTMKSRKRLFWTISPLQILHFTTGTITWSVEEVICSELIEAYLQDFP
jgi:hypothetical protein